MPSPLSHTWAIVLAGGKGARLQPLIREHTGRVVPKQFCCIGDDQSLLQRTVHRIAPLVGTPRVVVATQEWMVPIAASQLSPFHGARISALPTDAGTAPAVLHALAAILARDPRATVIVVPSDQSIDRWPAFASATLAALNGVERDPSRLVVLGARPLYPATDLHWLVPAADNGSDEPVHGVDRLVDRPSQLQADSLFMGGSLWSTGIVVSYGWTLVTRFCGKDEALAAALLLGARTASRSRRGYLRSDLESLPYGDFTRDILAQSPNLAAATLAAEAGWTDLGTPARARAWLNRRRRSAPSSPAADLPAQSEPTAAPRPDRLRSGQSSRIGHFGTRRAVAPPQSRFR